MKLTHTVVLGGTLAALVTLQARAMAQSSTATKQPASSAAAGDATPLPPPRSYDTPPPPAPRAGIPSPSDVKPGITKEAGIGGTQAYARAGVLELGGAMGFSRASSFTTLNINPSVGWFFANNWQISGILGLEYVHTSIGDVTSNNTVVSVLAEPSYHLPFTDYLYGFLGIGAGINYANAGQGGAGIAIVPRLGANIIVGRSGILTPALVVNYSTSEAVSANGQTGDHFSLGFNVGYTVMW